MPSGDKRSPPKHQLMSTISILNWLPDLDELQKTLTGAVSPKEDDVISRGGQQWPQKHE